MKLNYYSSLFSKYVRIAGADSRADKQIFNIIKSVFNRVGIKFVIISAGKLYSGELGLKKIFMV